MFRRAIVVGLSAALALSAAPSASAADLERPGAVDLNFNPGAGFEALEDDAQVYGDVVPTDDGFLIGGKFDRYRGFEASGIASIRADGSFNRDFRFAVEPRVIPIGNVDVRFGNSVLAIEPIGNGQYLIGGQFADGETLKVIDRSGREDPDFEFQQPSSSNRVGFPDWGFNGYVMDIQTVRPGVFLVAGQFSRFSRVKAKGIARVILGEDRILRLDPDFQSQLSIRDRRYGAPSDPWISTIGTRRDGSILIGGFFDKYQGEKVGSIAQIAPNGELLNDFDGGARAGRQIGQVFSILTSRNGPDLVGGSFTSFGSDSAARGLAVLDGRRVRAAAPRLVDVTDFCPRPPGEGLEVAPAAPVVVRKIVPTSEGGYLMTGVFDGVRNIDGTGHNSVGVSRLDSDLRADWTFMDSRGRPGGLFDVCSDGSRKFGYGMTIGELDNDRIVVGGDFTTAFDVQTLRDVDAPDITMLWDTKLEETELIPRSPVFPDVKAVSEKDLVDIVFAVNGRSNDSRGETWGYRVGEIGIAGTDGGPCEVVESVTFEEADARYNTVTVQHRPRSGAGTYICARQLLGTNLRELASEFAYLPIVG